MATIKPVIFKPKVLKDGTHRIRIAVCHKRQTAYIITNYIVEENQFRNGQVIKRPDASIINRKLRSLLDEYQDRLDSISHQELYSCTQLKNLVEKGAFTNDDITFQEMSSKYIDELLEKHSEGYAGLIECNSRYFTEFTGGPLAIKEINLQILYSYQEFLKDEKGLGNTTICMMMRHTRTIINKAIKRRIVKIDINPFLGFSIPSSPVRECDISVETFNKIRNAHPKEHRLRVARDLFCLSFYLAGMNLVDILEIDFRKTELNYIRTKTVNTVQGNKNISFTIPDEAMEIADNWINKKNGRLDFGYKFSYNNFRSYVTKCLHKLVTQLGIEEKVIFYSARKSFAQFASELGIPDGVIDYCLGHSDGSKGVIRYYTKVKAKQADIAIKRVIDYVNNPEKYKDYIEMRSDIMMMR